MIRIKPDMQFFEARYILKHYNGFYHRMGYPYLFTPDSRGKDVNDLIPNTDYFTSDYHLKRYLNEKFDWTGPSNEHDAITRNKQNSRKLHFKIKIKNTSITFPEMRYILKSKYGFHYRIGSPYLFSAESRCKDFKDLIPNIDYFTSDRYLKQFLKNQYDWSERDISFGSKYDNSKILVSPEVTRKITKRVYSKTSDDEKNEDPIMKNKNVVNGDTSCNKETYIQTNETEIELSYDIKKQNVSNTHHNKSKKRITRIIDEVNPTKKKKTKANYSPNINVAEQNALSIKHESDSSIATKLDYCLQALCSANSSKDSIYIGTGNSILTSKLKIISFLENCIRNDTETVNHSSVLYICGRPGTGKVSILSILCFIFLTIFTLQSFPNRAKTMLINHCLSTIQDSNKYHACKSVYLNAASIVSYENVIKEIAGALGKNSNSTSTAILAIEKTLRRKHAKPLILVIDEIDFLTMNHERSKAKQESHMDIVFRWAAKIEFALTVVCISNSVGDDFAKTFHRMVKVNY